MKRTRLRAGCLWAAYLGAALAGVGLACGDSDPAEGPRDATASPTAQPGEDFFGQRPHHPALDAALGEADPYARTQKVAELLPTLGAEAVPAVRERLARGVNLRAPEFEMLLRFWASFDPSAALNWALATPPRNQVAAIAIATEVWAETDPEAALAGVKAALQLPANQLNANVARSALVRGWFRANRAGLEKYMQSLGATTEREEAVFGYALSLLAADGSDALLRWAEAVPVDDPTYKQTVNYQTTSALAGLEPEVAVSWCDAHCEGPHAVGMRQVVAMSRLNSRKDIPAMIEWVARAPETESNDQILVASYATWAWNQPETALPWMRQKDADGKDPWVHKLYAPFARQLSLETPAEAITWAERVEAESEREGLLVEIARRWRLKDEAAAEAWLASSALSEQAREKVREPKPPELAPVPVPSP